jgi:hypothetical protein
VHGVLHQQLLNIALSSIEILENILSLLYFIKLVVRRAVYTQLPGRLFTDEVRRSTCHNVARSSESFFDIVGERKQRLNPYTTFEEGIPQAA